MTKKEEKEEGSEGVFDIIDGLIDVDPKTIAPFIKAMEEAIPEIVRDEEERRVLAAESRQWPLKS